MTENKKTDRVNDKKSVIEWERPTERDRERKKWMTDILFSKNLFYQIKFMTIFESDANQINFNVICSKTSVFLTLCWSTTFVSSWEVIIYYLCWGRENPWIKQELKTRREYRTQIFPRCIFVWNNYNLLNYINYISLIKTQWTKKISGGEKMYFSTFFYFSCVGWF